MAARKKKTSRRKASTKKKYEHLPARSEAEQVASLSEDLVEAWERLRDFLSDLGPQEVRTTHRAIVFSRKTCYAFVRPKKSFLETVFFLSEPLPADFFAKVEERSKTKFAHVLKLTHRDQIEEPLTDWLRQAFALS